MAFDPRKGSSPVSISYSTTPEAIDVGPGIGAMGLPARLLRTHVGDGAHKLALNGQNVFEFGTQGQTEVDDHRAERSNLTTGRCGWVM